mmetsp:Transcript_11412/g.30227  ORF Transcript_11412/g.30227 Transcript_11412/m.30227 type:complete len:237 (+) Transcript_11412:669-1379(+)
MRKSIIVIPSGSSSLVRPDFSHVAARSCGLRKTGRMFGDCSSSHRKIGSCHAPASIPASASSSSRRGDVSLSSGMLPCSRSSPVNGFSESVCICAIASSSGQPLQSRNAVPSPCTPRCSETPGLCSRITARIAFASAASVNQLIASTPSSLPRTPTIPPFSLTMQKAGIAFIFCVISSRESALVVGGASDAWPPRSDNGTRRAESTTRAVLLRDVADEAAAAEATAKLSIHVDMAK